MSAAAEVTPASLADELAVTERSLNAMRRSLASLPNGAARVIASDRLSLLLRDRDRILVALRAVKPVQHFD